MHDSGRKLFSAAPDLARITRGSQVSDALSTMFGPHALAHLQRRPSVIHVTSVLAAPSSDAPFQTLLVNEAAPRHAHDTLILNIARAAADAIVQTGATLRDEPRLASNIRGPNKDAIVEWRNSGWLTCAGHLFHQDRGVSPL